MIRLSIRLPRRLFLRRQGPVHAPRPGRGEGGQGPVLQPRPDPEVDPRPLPEPSAEELERIEAAVASLPPLEREVFLAARLDGMDYREIARRTGRSVHDIERRMSRAIRVISKALEEGGGP
ncbi:RNA polymerase sigma factor (sigma-70 family) [Novosphingobium sp. PhB55]|nr:RNA polymerase sigma factor (sigma-70 family) [Novosphingobium sp. PhB55]